MKTKHFLTLVFLLLAMSASAQIQLLYWHSGRNVIDRTKKLYWMDGDSDPCFNIQNYKKAGNKETFTLVGKENPSDKYSAVITLNSQSVPVHLVLKQGGKVMYESDLKTTSGNKDEDDRMYAYFGELAGYPAKQSVGSVGVPSKPTAADVKKGGVKGVASKASETAKGAFGKVKGLFKKSK